MKMIKHAITLFSCLPQLTELELCVRYTKERTTTALPPLNALNNLRKLSFQIDQLALITPASDYHSNLGSLRELVACNPHLAHLSVQLGRHNDDFDLADIFSAVPAERPLHLQYLSLSYQFINGWDATKILPHICSLTSIDLRFCTFISGADSTFHKFWSFLFEMNVFPKDIKISHLDQRFFDYLQRHPNLHAGTLEYLRMFADQLSDLLRVGENWKIFLRCTRMREIYINSPRRTGLFSTGDTKVECVLLNLVAHLIARVILVFESYQSFDLYRNYCHDSDNPLEIQLESRLFLSS
ncbi:hypothetical protein AMATHDRAFT_4642 [Amanita thiersii Skay4041]|uniref:F-box domain-containing protein n=1 Tax=Amanita thiersii Skay4041 TaxID=703135 RepID=A0A2A9NN65_9AGAR|nr:hypothetical protein AMATHDRAFT_4642 [Amanita thiersii Skay4041]